MKLQNKGISYVFHLYKSKQLFCNFFAYKVFNISQKVDVYNNVLSTLMKDSKDEF